MGYFQGVIGYIVLYKSLAKSLERRNKISLSIVFVKYHFISFLNLLVSLFEIINIQIALHIPLHFGLKSTGIKYLKNLIPSEK